MYNIEEELTVSVALEQNKGLNVSFIQFYLTI